MFRPARRDRIRFGRRARVLVASAAVVFTAAGCGGAPGEPGERPAGQVGQDAGTSALDALLDRRNDAADRGDTASVAATDEEIKRRFEQPVAVMFTDLTGFTRRTQAKGVIWSLSLVRRLVRMTDPLVSKYGARWVKIDGDSFFIIHHDPLALFDLAEDLRTAAAQWDSEHADDAFGLSIGLGNGPSLVVSDDVWGNAVNTAAKLGEDTAEAGELLVSQDFFAALDGGRGARCPDDPAAARESQVPFRLCR